MLPFILPDPTKQYQDDQPVYCYKLHFLCTPADPKEIHFIKNSISYGYSIPNIKEFIVNNIVLLRLGLYFIDKRAYDNDDDIQQQIQDCLSKALHPPPKEYFRNMMNILDKYIEYTLNNEYPNEDSFDDKKFNKLVEICEDEIHYISNIIQGIINSHSNKKKKKKNHELGIQCDTKSIENLTIKNKNKNNNNGKNTLLQIDSLDNIVTSKVHDDKKKSNKYEDLNKFYFYGFSKINILDNESHDRYMCITHYLRQRVINELNKQLQLLHGSQKQILSKKKKIAKKRINQIIDEAMTIGNVQEVKLW